MAKLVKSLKNLGAKLTGSEIKSNKLVEVLNETADKYSGGGSGGGTAKKVYKHTIKHYGGSPFSYSYIYSFTPTPYTSWSDAMLDFQRKLQEDNYVYRCFFIQNSGEVYDWTNNNIYPINRVSSETKYINLGTNTSYEFIEDTVTEL